MDRVGEPEVQNGQDVLVDDLFNDQGNAANAADPQLLNRQPNEGQPGQ